MIGVDALLSRPIDCEGDITKATNRKVRTLVVRATGVTVSYVTGFAGTRFHVHLTTR